jgi:hypothetical protein
MLYFFHRGRDVLRCEVRSSADGEGYEICVIDASGQERIERQATSESVHKRWLEMHKSFENEGWHGPVTYDGRG